MKPTITAVMVTLGRMKLVRESYNYFKNQTYPAKKLLIVTDGQKKEHDALKALATVDPRKSQVVELRFFAGLTVEETSEVLKVSTHTVVRDWRLAKVWLLREMGRQETG